MPTERFNQLSKAKQQRILRAAEAEFQASCAEKFSMTRIARNASVSRASLYTYFVDREDIYFYSLAQVGRNMREDNMRRLGENGGDVWEMLAWSMENQLASCRKSLLYRMRYLPGQWRESISADRGDVFQEGLKEYEKWIYENCSNPELRQLGERRFITLLEACHALITVCLQESLLTGGEFHSGRKRFREKLDDIKSLVCGVEIIWK